ncbi:MAG: hypothetical protein WCK31_03215 [bacterium]
MKETIFTKLKKVLTNPEFWLVLIILIGFGIRLFNLPKEPFGNDLKYFQDWTTISLKDGISNIYNSNSEKLPVDYPPVYLYVLTTLGNVSQNMFNVDVNSSGFEYFIKFLNIYIDFGVSIFIYLIVMKLKNKTFAVISFAAYFLNPYVIYVTAIWGQVDSLISFFTLASLYLYLTKYNKLSYSLMTLGLLTKFQVIVSAPFILFHYLFSNTFKNTLKSALLAIFTAILIVSPFLFTGNIGKVVETYTSSTGRYPAISMNAYNLWWPFANPFELFAVNSDTPLKDLSYSPSYKEGSFEKNQLLSSKNLAFFLFFICFIILCINVVVNKDFDNLFLTMATGVLAFFTLNVQMHERYLFPFFAIFALIFYKKLRYTVIFILLSILGWINLMFVFSPNSIVTNFRKLTYPALTYVISGLMVIILLTLIVEVIRNIIKGIRKY